MKNRNIIIAIICTLIMGFVLGFFLSGRLARNRMEKVRARMESPKAERMFLSKKLDLTKEQEESIRPLMDSMLTRQSQLRDEHHAEMRKIRKSMFNEIRKELNPKQLKKLEKMNSRREKRPKRPRPH